MSAEDIRKVKVNPFYVRKMRTYFQGVDQDKSGILTREDHELLATRYKDLAHLDTLREKQARRKIMTLWDYFFEEASQVIPLDPEMFGKCIAYKGREQIISSASHYGDILFDLIDLNADGVISLKEFTNLHKLFFLNEKTAEAAFKALDEGNKGYIVHGEFNKAVVDFFLPEGETELPTTKIFGPLLD